MRLTTIIIDAFGADRLLHFAFAALFTALGLPFIHGIIGIWAVIIPFAVVTALGCIKELYLDLEADWHDFYAGIIGGAMIVLYAGMLM